MNEYDKRQNIAFICHRGTDAVIANRVAKCLVAHGIQPWLDTEHLDLSKNIHKQIYDAINKCDLFIALINPNNSDSSWTSFEKNIARSFEKKVINIDVNDGDDYDICSKIVNILTKSSVVIAG